MASLAPVARVASGLAKPPSPIAVVDCDLRPRADELQPHGGDVALAIQIAQSHFGDDV